jgi:hypothetical protein
MNRPFGNLPISWYNSPSIVFNKRTSGWMPPERSTLMGRNQIVSVDDNMNFVRELSNDFPPAQMAVWQTPQGQYGPPGVIPGPPYAPGASPLSGAYGAFMNTAQSLVAMPMSFLEKWKDWVMGLGAIGQIVYWLSIAAGAVWLLGKFKFGRKLTSQLGLAKVPIIGKLVRKNPAKAFGRWKKKGYARRHGKKKMSAAYMKRHNRRRSRK